MLQQLGWSVAAIAMGALSIATMSGEVRTEQLPIVSAKQPPGQLFGLSHRSATATLESCEEYLARPASRALPTPDWRGALEGCRAQANLVIERWPTDARAWLLVASASQELGDAAGLAEALRRSQLLAPQVQWLAERRLRLADKTGNVGDYSYDGDVLALLGSDIGARVIAASWLAGDAARRARIESAAELADAPLQQRLLDKIRALAGSTSPT